MSGANAALNEQPLPRTRAAPVYAIASGKGGVGKTWLSTMLSIAFGRAGQRALLVDCDLGLANVDVQLGVRPTADVHSVVRGFLELESAVTPVMGGPGRNGGFDLIAGHSGSGALGAVKLEEVGRICTSLNKLTPHYDRVILDLAAGIDPVRAILLRDETAGQLPVASRSAGASSGRHAAAGRHPLRRRRRRRL